MVILRILSFRPYVIFGNFEKQQNHPFGLSKYIWAKPATKLWLCLHDKPNKHIQIRHANTIHLINTTSYWKIILQIFLFELIFLEERPAPFQIIKVNYSLKIWTPLKFFFFFFFKLKLVFNLFYWGGLVWDELGRWVVGFTLKIRVDGSPFYITICVQHSLFQKITVRFEDETHW